MHLGTVLLLLTLRIHFDFYSSFLSSRIPLFPPVHHSSTLQRSHSIFCAPLLLPLPSISISNPSLFVPISSLLLSSSLQKVWNGGGRSDTPQMMMMVLVMVVVVSASGSCVMSCQCVCILTPAIEQSPSLLSFLCFTSKSSQCLLTSK